MNGLEVGRDVEIGARIQAMEVRPGDALVLRLRGIRVLMIQDPDVGKAIAEAWRRALDAAGFQDTKMILLDFDENIEVIRQPDEPGRILR